MNRLADLIDRLATLRDERAKALLIADHLTATAEPERRLTVDVLLGRLKPRTVRLALIRGLAEARLDPVLFELARDYTGDLAETIALAWPARRGANKDPTLAEVIEGLATLGRSELPKRIGTWLDACDANGRWALIKLATGTLRADAKPETVAIACARAGLHIEHAPSGGGGPGQDEMFAPAPRTPIAGTVAAVLMYVERTNPRVKDSPLRVTFGLWSDDVLIPVGKLDLDAGAILDDIERYVAANTTARFGPVREVARTRTQSLVLEIAYDDIERAPRRKAGIVLVNPSIAQVLNEAPPDRAASLKTLVAKLPSS